MSQLQPPNAPKIQPQSKPPEPPPPAWRMTAPLSQRMREAAQVLSEAAARLSPNNSLGWMYSTWHSESLHRVAAEWEQEDAAKEAAEVLLEDIACGLYLSLAWGGCEGAHWLRIPEDSPTKAEYRKVARKLVAEFDIRHRAAQ